MNTVYKVVHFWIDFLFPKKRVVLELESLPQSTLISSLPPAPSIDEEVIAIFDYQHPLVKELVWELKYAGNRLIAEKLGEILYDFISDELMEKAIFDNWSRPIIMPIPISDKRRFERGWNQTEILCKSLADLDRENRFKYLPRHLSKIRHTESQTTTASRKERLENIKGSMRVLHPPAVEKRCVILVDDVVTTGATFAEARRVLLEAGAEKVLSVAIAH